MVLAQARMETRLLLRNGEQLLLAVVIPLIVLVGGVLAAVTAWCAKLDVMPDRLTVAKSTLEDVFLELTGRGLRS
jgi:hypothetical protein